MFASDDAALAEDGFDDTAVHESASREEGAAQRSAVRSPLFFLAGATAVGKSAVALLLAESHGLEIISIDSRQIYRNLEIGTAKPIEAERRRVPHHLIDRLDPRDSCSAGHFRDLYRETLVELSRRSARSIAVGGTGLYWEACTRGLHPLPPVDRELRTELEEIAAREGVSALHEQLVRLDPAGASRIPPQNRQRVMRALELVRQTGQSLVEIFHGPRSDAIHDPIPTFVLTRDRADLYARIDRRCEEMLEAGLLEEVRSLLDRGVPADAPGMRTLGYREMADHLAGHSWEEARERFHRHSRQYAKRQETWFRHRLPEALEIAISPDESPQSVAQRLDALASL
jgi:tRNA dimethylallyltransferase